MAGIQGAKGIVNQLWAKDTYFSSFDKIIVYYGQVELAQILVSVFNTMFSNVEFYKEITDITSIVVGEAVVSEDSGAIPLN